MHSIHENKSGIVTTRFCFGGGSPGTPPPVPKPPALPDANAATANQPAPGSRQSGAARAGYGSTLLTGGQGVQNQTSQKKTLLGV